MAGLADMVVEFLSGISDMAVRDNVLLSVLFLRDVYADGRGKAEDILNDLREICSFVLREKHKDWSEEQIAEEADAKAREFFRVLGVEAFSKRLRAKYASLPY